MTLKEWMLAESISRPEFAAMIGRTVEAVRRYEEGERIPDRDTMPVIVIRTRGQVTPNDFFGVEAAASRPEAA